MVARNENRIAQNINRVAQNENGMKMERTGARPAPALEKSIGNIIGAFKSITTNEYIQGVKQIANKVKRKRLKNNQSHTG